MVLTPQLLQAIKLLQMPNLELTQFIENELTSNPLLERAEEREEPGSEPTDPPGFAEAPAEPGDWAGEALETDAGRLAANLGTEVDNAFDADRSAPSPSAPAESLSALAWTGVGAGAPVTTPAKPPISKLMSPSPYRSATISSVRPRSCLPTRPSA